MFICTSRCPFVSVPEFECDVLTDQPNADKTGSGNKFQDSVTYKCHSGFQVEGEVNSFQRQLYCQADGKWSDDVPNCIRKYGYTHTHTSTRVHAHTLYTGVACMFTDRHTGKDAKVDRWYKHV